MNRFHSKFMAKKGFVTLLLSALVLMLALPGCNLFTNVDPKDMNGTWEGSMTLTDSTDEDDEKDIGDEEDCYASIKLDKDGEGTFSFLFIPLDCEFNGRTLTIDDKQEGIEFTGDLDVSEDDGDLILTGEIEMVDTKKDESATIEIEITQSDS